MSKLGRALDAVGGSDIAAIRGEDPYRTPREVWERIVHGRERSEYSIAAELGNAAEETILNDYMLRHGIERTSVERTKEVFLSDAEPYFRGELDLYVPDGNYAVDAKLVLSPASAKLFGDEGTDQLSDYILNQQAWYCIVAGLDFAKVAAVIYGRPVDYIYTRVPAFEAMVLGDVRRFWSEYVKTGIPPEPIRVEDALLDFPQPKADIRKATDEEAEIVRAWREAKAVAAEHEAEVEKAKAKVCAAIGDSEGLWLGGSDRVTWKMNKSGSRTLRG